MPLAGPYNSFILLHTLLTEDGMIVVCICCSLFVSSYISIRLSLNWLRKHNVQHNWR